MSIIENARGHAMRAAIIALMLMFGSQAGAENKQVSFGGGILNLPKPKDLCEMADHGPTSEIFKFHAALQAKAKNRLLAVYEDCLFLEQRTFSTVESSPPEWLLFTAFNPNPDKEILFKNYSTQRFIEEMAKMVSNIDANEIQKWAGDITDQVLEDLSYDENIAFGKPIDLGVLDIGDAVYHGFIMDVKGGNESFIVGAVFSYLLVNGVAVNIYKYKNYKNKQTIKDLLFESKYYVARVVHSN